MNSEKLLSIIIPHLKGKDILSECLKSIFKYKPPINYEIIIVNNNSQDGSIPYIKEKFENISIINSNVNKGYAGGCNLGAQHAKGNYLLFLNNDTTMSEYCLEYLISKIQEDDKIASVQPKIKNYFNTNMFDYAGASGGYIDYLGYPFSRGRIFNTIEKDLHQYDDEKKIFWASGTAFITKSKIFHQIDGFDESLFAHMEEIDYHWKCLSNGYKIYIQPKSVIYHKGGQTLKYGSHQKTYLNHRNSIILFLTNNKNLSWFIILKRILLEDMAFLYYLLTGKLKLALAVMKANLWCVFNINYLLRRRRKNANIMSDYKISDKLMVPYSIVKAYFYNQKKKFDQLN